MAQAFVTGGSGFIGQVLVRRLRAEGHSVRALVRSQESAAKVSALGAEPVRGELTEPATWRDEVTGSDVLFHLAAETDISASRARQELVTVGGTRETVFEIYGVGRPTAELDAETAAREIPVPARWFLGQTCTLRTDKAAAELGYKPIVAQADGLDAVRNSVNASRA